MRISDIYKNNPSKKTDHTASHSNPASPTAHQIHLASQQTPAPDTRTAHPFAETAEKVYTDAIIEAKNIFAAFAKKEVYPDEIRSIAHIVRCVEERNQELVMLADRATPDTYLIGHAVNACIFAVMIGHSQGMAAAQLANLGLCAFLHDAGMADIQPLVLKKTKYSPAELTQIQMHSLASGTIVKGLPRLSEEAKALLITVVGQVHERENGTGYPFGIKSAHIHEYARIIAIADVYESLTHPRPHRDRILPHNALKQMINNGEYAFDTTMLKSFIEKISLYPPGSYVRLNTDEIARVIETHQGMPTRPKIKVIIGPDLQRSANPKIIDLQAAPMIFIKDAVDELSLNIPDKKLMLELKAVRWWVRGL